MKKRSVIKAILYSIVALMILFGIWFCIWSIQHKKKFEQWQTAKPIDIAVDVSKLATYSGAFNQTCHIAHGEMICLVVPDQIMKDKDCVKFFEELKLHCVITDDKGTEVMQADFKGVLNGNTNPGEIPIIFFAPFSDGEYTLDLHVSQAISELKDVPQRLVARYKLCGLELLPAQIGLMIGIGLIALGGTCGLVTCICMIKPAKSSNSKS